MQNIAQQLQNLFQGPTPIDRHEHHFNMIAQPLLQIPQYQPELQRLYVHSLNDDLKRALQGLSFHSLYELQHETRMLSRKFVSMDAYNTLYTLRQGHKPIAQHNYEIDSLLALLEVPMADDLLQDMYRKSIRSDARRAIGNREFASFNDLRRAVAMICP